MRRDRLHVDAGAERFLALASYDDCSAGPVRCCVSRSSNEFVNHVGCQRIEGIRVVQRDHDGAVVSHEVDGAHEISATTAEPVTTGLT